MIMNVGNEEEKETSPSLWLARHTDHVISMNWMQIIESSEIHLRIINPLGGEAMVRLVLPP